MKKSDGIAASSSDLRTNEYVAGASGANEDRFDNHGRPNALLAEMMANLRTTSDKLFNEHTASPHMVRRWQPILVVASVLSILVLGHGVYVNIPWTRPTWLTPLNSLYDLALVATLFWLAWAAGRRLLGMVGVPFETRLEAAIFAIPIGLACFAYLTFFLALGALLEPRLFLVLGGMLAIILRDDLLECLDDLGRAGRSVRFLGAGTPDCRQLIAVILAPIAVVCLCIALLPPFGYDALQYHLEAPRRLIEAHRYIAIPDISQAAMPFTAEMLYTICLLFGSEAGAALVHLSQAFLTACTIWVLARRFFDSRVAWVAVAAFATASNVQRWAPVANIDLTLTLFQFQALGAVLIWRERRQSAWLVLAGVLTGVTLGIKYTAAPSLVVLAIIIITADGLRGNRLLGRLKPNVIAALVACGVALTVASPWYLKNAIVFHDPVAPLLMPAYVDPALRLTDGPSPSAPAAHSGVGRLVAIPFQLLTTGNEFSLSGRSWHDYLTVPFWIYVRGDLEQVGRPSLLFLTLPFSLVFARRQPVVIRLVAVAAATSVIWLMGSQELRYLLPEFPLYAILSATAIVALADRLGSEGRRRRLIAWAVVLSAAASFVETGLYAAYTNPIPVIAGLESKASFLQRVDVHRSQYEFLRRVVQPGDLTLAIGEKRGYYARTPLLLDNSTGNLGVAFLNPGSPDRVADLFRRSHIAYVLVDSNDLSWLAQFDPGRVNTGLAAFNRFKARYLTPVYSGDTGVEVYRFEPTGVIAEG